MSKMNVTELKLFSSYMPQLDRVLESSLPLMLGD